MYITKQRTEGLKQKKKSKKKSKAQTVCLHEIKKAPNSEYVHES